MSEKSRAILELMKQPGNNVCADCGETNPEWASAILGKGLFICITCSGIHRNLGVSVSVVKSLRLDTWTEERLKLMRDHGNRRGNAVWTYNVPLCYRRPKPADPHVLKEQWIRAKYERKEFLEGASPTSYTSGTKRGYLRKKGKKDNNWNVRLFVLSEAENTLRYYIEDQHKDPKDTLKLTEINVVFAEEKTNKETSLQICFVREGRRRNLFVCSETGQEIVEWYMAIRSAKLNLLGLNKPGVDPEEISNRLTTDFTIEGYLNKKKPREQEPFQRRWFTLDGRRLLYFKDPTDAFAKGELILGTKDLGFDITEGFLTNKHKEVDNCFTICTPKRNYEMSANTDSEKQQWIDALTNVLKTPMADEDKQEMKETMKVMASDKRHSLLRPGRRFSYRGDESD